MWKTETIQLYVYAKVKQQYRQVLSTEHQISQNFSSPGKL